MTQPCKICRGTGRVECPNQLCAHWCPCTVCGGTGKVEVWEDWSQGFGEEKVRAVTQFAQNILKDMRDLTPEERDALNMLYDETFKEAKEKAE